MNLAIRSRADGGQKVGGVDQVLADETRFDAPKQLIISGTYVPPTSREPLPPGIFLPFKAPLPPAVHLADDLVHLGNHGAEMVLFDLACVFILGSPLKDSH